MVLDFFDMFEVRGVYFGPILDSFYWFVGVSCGVGILFGGMEDAMSSGEKF